MDHILKRLLLNGAHEAPFFMPADDGGNSGGDAETNAQDKKQATDDQSPSDGEKDQQNDDATLLSDDQSQDDKQKTDDADKSEGEEDQKDDKSSDDGEKLLLTDEMRDQIANGDKKVRSLLSRYTTLPSMARALAEANRKISQGNKAPERPDPADKEAMQKYRKEMGLPESADGYKLNDSVLKRLGDDDKPMLADFTEFAHERGATPQELDLAIEWYAERQEAAMAQEIEADRTAKTKAEDDLRAEWGPEYRANLSMASRMVESIPGVGPDWNNLKLEDGRKLGNIPEFITHMAELGRREFGDPVFADSDSEAAHNSRKAELEKIRDSDIDKWDSDSSLKKELTEIYAREEKRKK
ncbi:hypothetical protein MXMO3_01706 [Maritalea myrionectae]|uniref:Uncharacterized protein n=1 Tax=Maritalea myrionectae TaxID=454601 RepID=A0A2R4MDZ4_9HYPH|nr:hypothetical protein [Maritalea myrionectae]AVX04232.1 hypothetical protein MXMO3_01706 [Maritalea myrionectae]